MASLTKGWLVVLGVLRGSWPSFLGHPSGIALGFPADCPSGDCAPPERKASFPEMMMGQMKEQAQYGSVLESFSDVLRDAEAEAVEEVNALAAEAGEEAAFETSLEYAFIAFDEDGDGQLSGEEVRTMLEVIGRELPASLDEAIKAEGYRCTLEDFAQLYESSAARA
mmetsp:Transcript_60036/g.106844  ORF Transcript_60036/g.106844 Transcript_60036/m.106844 type:complete len:167 (+) Transcript_60036:50-550(+)